MDNHNIDYSEFLFEIEQFIDLIDETLLDKENWQFIKDNDLFPYILTAKEFLEDQIKKQFKNNNGGFKNGY